MWHNVDPASIPTQEIWELPRRRKVLITGDVENRTIVCSRPNTHLRIQGTVKRSRLMLRGNNGKLQVTSELGIHESLVLVDGWEVRVDGWTLLPSHIHARHSPGVRLGGPIVHEGVALIEPDPARRMRFTAGMRYRDIGGNGEIDKLPFLVPGDVYIPRPLLEQKYRAMPSMVQEYERVTSPELRQAYFDKVVKALREDCQFCTELHPKLQFEP